MLPPYETAEKKLRKSHFRFGPFLMNYECIQIPCALFSVLIIRAISLLAIKLLSGGEVFQN